MSQPIGANLKRIMKAQKLSVKDFAERMRTDERLVYRWRAGAKLPQAETIQRWAAILNVPYEELDPAHEAYAPGAPLPNSPSVRETARSAVGTRPGDASTEGRAPAMVEDVYFQSVRGNWAALTERQRERVMRFVANFIVEPKDRPTSRRAK